MQASPPRILHRGGGFVFTAALSPAQYKFKAMRMHKLQVRRAMGACAAVTLSIAVLAGADNAAHAQSAAVPKSAAEDPVPNFDPAYMTDAATIKVGQDVWGKQCRHCHGNSAYPGKAPKLSPGGLDPAFIYDRVTFGFRGMPAWNGIFTLEERRAVVAYIKSNSFAP